jgi:hypothetical protein
MRTFGSYEAVEELSRTAFGAVYSARPSGSLPPPKPGTPPAHFVKVFAPPALDDAGVRAGTQTENFLAAARLQQKAAASSRHWAPVHAIGTSAEGAYYVSSLYPMSARRLVMGRVKLTDADLHALATAIVQGLKDLRASCAQAHGNIKLTTVLLPRSGHAAFGQAVLAEPLLPHKAATVTEAADLGDLAKLVYHLVVHRPFSDAGGWPIPAGAEWSRLGPRGEAWRELCNALLDPANAGDGARGLDWLSGKLVELKPRRQLVSTKMQAAAVVVALLAGVGYGLFVHYAPYFLYKDDDWIVLVDAYGGWLRALDQMYPEIKTAMARDQELFRIVEDLKGQEIVFDPKLIRGNEADQFAYQDDGLKELLPTTAEARRRTQLAAAYVPKVEARLTSWRAMTIAVRVRDRLLKEKIAPGAAADLSRWLAQASTRPETDNESAPDVIKFAQAIGELAKLVPELDEVEKELKAVEEVVSPLAGQRIGAEGAVFGDLRDRLAAAYGGATSVAELLALLADVTKGVDGIRDDWTSVSAALTQAYDRDDEVLRVVPEFVRRSLYDSGAGASAEDGGQLAALARRVQKLRLQFAQEPWSELPERAAQWRAGRIDKDEFRRSPPYTDPAGRSPEALLGAWAANARHYVKPLEEDPRPKLAGREKELDEALGALNEDYPASAAVPREVLDVRSDVEKWKKAVAELRQPKWLSRSRGDIEGGVETWSKELERLLVAIPAARYVPAADRERYIAEVRGTGERWKQPALRQAWQDAQQAWFKDAAAWRQDAKTLRPTDFNKIKDDVKLAEKRLAEIDALSSRIDVKPGPQPPAWHGTLVAELEKLAEAELTKAVTAAVELSNWSDLAGDDFEKRWPAVRDAYRAWVEGAAGLVANLNLVEALLDGGYGLQPPVQAAYSSARKSGQWKAAEAHVGSLVSRIDRLEKLPNDRAELVKAAKEETDTSAAVAAWRRLGKPDWPGDVKELDEELEIQKQIGERLGVGGTKWPAADSILQKFRVELDGERSVRRQSAWLRLAEQIKYGDDVRRRQLDEVMARMTRCDIAFPPDGSPQIAAETWFNIALYRFRQDLQAYRRLVPPPDAVGREKLRKEQDRLATDGLARFKGDLPAKLTNEEWVRRLLAELDTQAKPVERGQVVMAEDGPLARRVKGFEWKMTADARDEVRTYTWGNHTLRFRRLDQPAGAAGDSVFLCMSEVPLGLFKEVIDAAAAEAKADPLRFAGLGPFGASRGPYVWDRVSLGPQIRWLPYARNDFVGKYADRFKGVDQQLKELALAMPVQRVPPAAAMHFAHLMGCRLPTSGEFDLARGMVAVVSKTAANLRDPAWGEQQAFLLNVVAKVGAGKGAEAATDAEDWAPWPDAGTFDKGDEIPSGPRAQVVQGVKDDGYLWFRPVHSDDTFGDLTGNVAEWLWDDVKVLEEAAKERKLEAFRAMVRRHWKGKLWVAGSSAISTFTPGQDRRDATNPDAGFADVGFRLAFTVPSRTIVDRMWLVADKQQYAPVAAAAGATAGRSGSN